MAAPDPVLFPIPYIRHIVGQAFRIDPGLLVGGRQERDISTAKYAAILVTLLTTNLSLRKVATGFYQDTTSIKHAAVVMIERMNQDPEMLKRLNRLIAMAENRLPRRWRRIKLPGRNRAATLGDIGERWGRDVANRRQRVQKKRATRAADEAPIAQLQP